MAHLYEDVLSVAFVPSSAFVSAEAVSLADSSDDEHAAKRTSCSRMDSEKKTERVCLCTLLGGKKDDGTTIPPPLPVKI